MPVYHTAAAAETIELGRRLAARLRPRDVVAFVGDLGRGKTTMIKGVAAGLGVTETVKSPSFVIVTEYAGRMPVFHIDLYRIDRVDQLGEVDLDDYFEADGVCLVEWADRLGPELPVRALRVQIDLEGEGRRIEITGRGSASGPVEPGE